jgi:hypothetical protein
MALATTTLAAACAAGDTSISVASATSVAAGRMIRVDNEVMVVAGAYVSGTSVAVLRGQNGTVSAAHAITANVTHGLPSDFGDPVPGADDSITYPARPGRDIRSYTAAGAIALPASGRDMVAIINGTATIAMTVAAPSKDLDGSILFVMGNGKSASTVTFAGGIGAGGASYDVATLQTGGQVGISAMACNGAWVLLNGPITGTSTALSFAVA